MRLVLINFSPRYLQLNKDPRIEIFIFKLVYTQDFMLFGKLGTTFVIFSFLHTFDWNLLLQGKRFTAVLKKGALPIPSFRPVRHWLTSILWKHLNDHRVCTQSVNK
jgi:hypothetical protein